MTRVHHELKCWTNFFQQVLDGTKPFELRRNDRDFKVGDVLHLREYEHVTQTYTGRDVRVAVTCIVPGSAWGLREGYCAMGIASIRPEERPNESLDLKHTPSAELWVESPSMFLDGWGGKELPATFQVYAERLYRAYKTLAEQASRSPLEPKR